MEEHLTTRQVAEALSVSESSIKRWCDNGVIPTIRTVGGHRRIPLAGFVEFLRETDRQVVTRIPALRNAELDGALVQSLGAEPGKDAADLGEIRLDEFVSALRNGDEARCRDIILRAYAAKESVAWIADELISKTMHSLGREWDCGDVEVYQERRGCEICMRQFHELRRLVPKPPANGPLAKGGAPEGDQNMLPSQLVELVLRESGWRATNLGVNLPFDTMAAAIQEHRPRLFWMSVSHVADPEEFVAGFQRLAESIPKETMVVLGGRALRDDVRPQLSYTSFCDNMHQLAAFATALHGKRLPIESSKN